VCPIEGASFHVTGRAGPACARVIDTSEYPNTGIISENRSQLIGDQSDNLTRPHCARKDANRSIKESILSSARRNRRGPLEPLIAFLIESCPTSGARTPRLQSREPTCGRLIFVRYLPTWKGTTSCILHIGSSSFKPSQSISQHRHTYRKRSVKSVDSIVAAGRRSS
jgi:hypothetical protein